MPVLKCLDKQIGKIEIKGKGEKVLLYNLSDILVDRKELNLPSGILVLKEEIYDSIYYGRRIEFSTIDIGSTTNHSVVIISPDDKLIYRTRSYDWAVCGDTIIIGGNILVTRYNRPLNKEYQGLINFDYTSNRSYNKNELPCLINLSSHLYDEYTYIYHNDRYVIAIENINSENGLIHIFDYNMKNLYQVRGHFNFGLLKEDPNSVYIIFNRSCDYYYLRISNDTTGEPIEFSVVKIYGLSKQEKVNILVPISFYNNYILFQTDINITVLVDDFQYVSTFPIPDKYIYEIKSVMGYETDGNIRHISRFVNINEKVYIECRGGYAGHSNCQYLDFMGNCVYSLNEIGYDLYIFKKHMITSCIDEPAVLFGLCKMPYTNLIPAIYDDIKASFMDSNLYIVAKKNLPNKRKLTYCFVIKITPVYKNNKVNDYNYEVSCLLDGEYDVDVQIYTRYGSFPVLELTEVGYGYENCEDNKPIPSNNKLFSPFVVCTRPDNRKKVICYPNFVSDYNYDDVCQLYLSPGYVDFFVLHNQKALLPGFLFVATKKENDNLSWGMIDIKGNIVINIKYSKICNRNGWVIADEDIYAFRNNAFIFLKSVINGVLIAWVDLYMAFELNNSTYLIIDKMGKLYHLNEKYGKIELPNNVYFDINNKYFVYVDEPNDIVDWDDGPSWKDLGKDEEEYIINNGGDWILDND